MNKPNGLFYTVVSAGTKSNVRHLIQVPIVKGQTLCGKGKITPLLYGTMFEIEAAEKSTCKKCKAAIGYE